MAKTSTKSASTKKSASAKSQPLTAKKPRRLKQPQYKSWRLQKRIKHPIKLPNVIKLTKMSAKTLWRHKKLFIGITLVYGLLNLILTQSLSGTSDIGTLKDTLDQAFQGHFGGLASGFSIFVVLVGSAGNSNSATAGAYQVFLALIVSLAVIWALRQVLSGTKSIRIRDAYYRGMTPLIPFLLVLLLIALQLLPMMIGANAYAIVISNGIAVYAVEKIVWALLYLLLALLSVYMISSSVFALYIVTLPDMTPIKALRSARALVRYRRWTVLRKILCLPVILLVIAAIIMVPIIIWLTPLAQWVFFLLTMFGLVAIHTYIYTLYRELLNE